MESGPIYLLVKALRWKHSCFEMIQLASVYLKIYFFDSFCYSILKQILAFQTEYQLLFFNSLLFYSKSKFNRLQFEACEREKSFSTDSQIKESLYNMKKINAIKLKPPIKLSARHKTLQCQQSDDTPKLYHVKSRFSCDQIDSTLLKIPHFQHDPSRRNNFSQISDKSTHDNLLRNMLQGNDRKRSQILNNLIKSKRKLFRTSHKNDQNFKKMIKLKTDGKENFFPVKQDRQKTLSKNIQFFKYSSRESGHLGQFYEQLLSQRRKPAIKLTQRESQYLKSSFNKRIKQIKLRKYFQKDELESNLANFFQAHAASIKGQKHQQNQDAVYFSQGIYVICDGHGSNGKQVSNFIAESIHNALSQVLEENKVDETIILETFRKIQLQLQNSNFDTSFSGCTCVALLRYEKTLFCISLGDSRAIMSKGHNVHEISITQKPDRPKQKQRIQNYGGVVRPTQVAKDKYVGPMRIWAPGKNSWGPGLALSRAFGDKAARKYGVISVPQVTQIRLTSDEEFIVMGSDGLFDYFSDHEICQYVKKLVKDQSIPRQEIGQQLVKEARKKWPQSSDDITCIVIFL